MKQVNKLIRKVKEYVQIKAERLIMVWIYPQADGSYKVCCHLWNGIPRSGTTGIDTHHNTMEEVEKQIDKIAAKYPNKFEDVNVYYDDVDE